ncbi:MAG: hypothetical protein U0V04_12785 [Spirosomataceae bacterium]|jgi:hypothetical protein
MALLPIAITPSPPEELENIALSPIAIYFEVADRLCGLLSTIPLGEIVKLLLLMDVFEIWAVTLKQIIKVSRDKMVFFIGIKFSLNIIMYLFHYKEVTISKTVKTHLFF